MPYHNLQNESGTLQNNFVIWVAMLFAAVAGYVNLVMLEATRMTLSHMTGNVSRLSEALYRGSEVSAHHFLMVVLSFILGASLSGFLLADQHFGMRRVYGSLMIVESALLGLTVLLFANHVWLAIYVVSFAMGQQNAMVSSFKGQIIRTTHMTGLLTDLGFLLGSFLKKGRFVFWRFAFYALLILGFFLGGWLGLLSFDAFAIYSLLVPIVLLFVLGLADILYVLIQRENFTQSIL